MIGPGKAFDTDLFFVVSTNLLGGCRGTTGPSSIDPATGRPYGSDFPVITVADMVRTERAFLDVLGIERLAAVAGGSLGGMQALEWAILYPDQVDAIVPIASTHALQPAGRGLERDRPRVDPARPGLAGRPLLRHRADARTPGWAWRGWSATSRTCPARRWPTSSAGGCRPSDDIRVHDHRTGVRGRELPAPPGRLVRQAVRRQHLPVHLARVDVLRSGPAVRRRIAGAGARSRLGPYAADRVQL